MNEKKKVRGAAPAEGSLDRALERMDWLEMRIASRSEQMVRLRDKANRMTASLSGVPGVRANDIMESAVVELVDMGEELKKDFAELARTRRRVKEAMQRLDSARKCSLMDMRYIDHMTWKEIAAAMHWSESNALRIHRESLKQLRVIWEAMDGKEGA